MDADKKWFAWGVGLAWVPVLLVIGPSFYSIFPQGFSQEKATGLAAVAGGFAEAMATFGMLAFVACQVAAVVLLARGIRREAWGRSMVAVVSLVCSFGILLVTVVTIWWWWHVRG